MPPAPELLYPDFLPLEVWEYKLFPAAELHRFNSPCMTASLIDEDCPMFPDCFKLSRPYFHIQATEAVKYSPLYLLRLNDCTLKIFKVFSLHYLYTLL